MTANLQNWLEIILLGAVEGITEFLPVSSTGHLIVAAHLLGRTEETDKLFEVVIQLGAVFAVCWHYRGRLWRAAKNPGGEKTLRLATNLILAFLPAAVFGLLFYSYIKEYLFSPQTVAAALIVGGIAILLIEKKKSRPARIRHRRVACARCDCHRMLSSTRLVSGCFAGGGDNTRRDCMGR